MTISRDDAIDFCESRQRMHEQAASKLKRESDIEQDAIASVKYKCEITLANTYGDIAKLLRDDKMAQNARKRP